MSEDGNLTPAMARPRMAAGVLIRNGAGEVLMVRPTYKDGWDIPGGYVEPDESPAAAAARELLEELGLDRPVGRLLVVDWAPHPAEGDKILWIFDGGTLADADLPGLTLQADEIGEARFQPASAFESLTVARLARRLHLVVKASATGRTIYAEHGAAPASPASALCRTTDDG